MAVTGIAEKRQVKGKLEVNWNKDLSTWTDESERLVTLDNLKMELHLSWKEGDANPFTAKFTLDNANDRYSSFNSSSPIYANIRYNKGHGIPIRFSIGIYDATAGWEYLKQFTGYIDQMDCTTRENVCTMSCFDNAHRLLQCKISTTMYQNQTVSDFLTVLCGADLANIE
jgi:hypothetical protein